MCVFFTLEAASAAVMSPYIRLIFFTCQWIELRLKKYGVFDVCARADTIRQGVKVKTKQINTLVEECV